MSRHDVARLFEPHDRFVDHRSHQMRLPYPAIQLADLGIPGAESDRLLQERDQPPRSTRL